MVALVAWLITWITSARCASINFDEIVQKPEKLTRTMARMKAEFLCASFTNNLLTEDGKYWPAHTYSKELKSICDEKYFRIRERLGSGSFGQVYRGIHSPTGTHVALKKIPTVRSDPDYEPERILSLIRNEECIHARLNHPIIPKFHCTYVKANGDVVLVMELIEGVNLLELVDPKSTDNSPIGSASRSDSVLSEEDDYTRFDSSSSSSTGPKCKEKESKQNDEYERLESPPETDGFSVDTTRTYSYVELKRWSAQLIRIITYLHSMDIIYADVKLENLLIDANDNLRLIDFGLANWWSGPQRFEAGLVGTPMYMSPEHLLSAGGIICPASDWYSVGLVLYEMLYQRDPFVGSVEEVQDIDQYMVNLTIHVTNNQLKCLKSKHPSMSDLIEKLTAIRPQDRLGYDPDLELRAFGGLPSPELTNHLASKEFTSIISHPWFSR